jgi:hypothetical protein
MERELNLTYLLELAQMPGAERMSSELTVEQRQAAWRDPELTSVVYRMRNTLKACGLSRELLTELGWPAVLKHVLS